MKKGLVLLLLAGLTGLAQGGTPPAGRYLASLNVLRQLQRTYPQYSAFINLGTNNEGIDILGLRVSVTPQTLDPRKIGHLVVSTHHGNELKATDFTLAFTEALLKRYASHALYSSHLPDTEWTIIPVLNVSGYNAGNRHEHGYDSNRDYPGPCQSGQTGKLASIRLMMNLLQARRFAGSVTVHGYIGALTYPWGISSTHPRTLDHNAYDRIFSKAASLNGYRYGTSTEVIYPAPGTFEDYAYWKHGVWSMLLELKDGSPRDIQTSVAAVEAYFDQIETSPSNKHSHTGQCTYDGRDPRLD